MNTTLLLLCIGFLLIAMIYSSVGFGGGSSYLALLALTGLSFPLIRTSALLCNIVVVAGGSYIFYREGKLDLRKSLPFLLTSVPLAFLGGFFRISERQFFITLGISLVVASFFLWFHPDRQVRVQSGNLLLNGTIGGAIGFLSGLVGIGGGIFLAPVLHFLRWDEPRRIAALASVFILVNSISGLFGQLLQQSAIDWNFVWPLLVAVVIGGQIGSRLGARTFHALYVKRITAVLILVAGTKILIDYF